jgi:hypothetical protein
MTPIFQLNSWVSAVRREIDRRFEEARLVLGWIGVAAVLAIVAVYVEGHALASRRLRLESQAEADRVNAGDAAATLDFLNRMLVAMARHEIVADEASTIDATELHQLLSERGLYLHAVLDEIGTAPLVAVAAEQSRKDPFVGCLTAPPGSLDDAAIVAAATHARWSVALDDATKQVTDLGVVLASLRTSTLEWKSEISAANDPTDVHLLEIVSRRQRRSPPVLTAAKASANARWFAAQLDDPPYDPSRHGGPPLAEAMRGSRMDYLSTTPHAARVVLFDLSKRSLVLATRTTVDATRLHVKEGVADSEELQGCQAAIALRAMAKAPPTP